jgi:hypothetical protein
MANEKSTNGSNVGSRKLIELAMLISAAVLIAMALIVGLIFLIIFATGEYILFSFFQKA